MNNQQKITCPTCGKHDTWHPENAFRPFCSDRCKLTDLGEWASESRKISGAPANPDVSAPGNLDAEDSGDYFY